MVGGCSAHDVKCIAFRRSVFAFVCKIFELLNIVRQDAFNPMCPVCGSALLPPGYGGAQMMQPTYMQSPGGVQPLYSPMGPAHLQRGGAIAGHSAFVTAPPPQLVRGHSTPSHAHGQVPMSYGAPPVGHMPMQPMQMQPQMFGHPGVGVGAVPPPGMPLQPPINPLYAQHGPAGVGPALASVPAPPGDPRTWSPAHVAQWFASLGQAFVPFGQKAQSLGMDGGVLLSINADSLSELGCTGKIQQTKVTQELDKLRVTHGLPLSPSASGALSASAAVSPRSGGAGTGQLTVIQFSELAGMKELASGHYATYVCVFSFAFFLVFCFVFGVCLCLILCGIKLCVLCVS